MQAGTDIVSCDYCYGSGERQSKVSLSDGFDLLLEKRPISAQGSYIPKRSLVARHT